MQTDDRPIHFSTELLYPARPLEVPVLQKLYYNLSQTVHGAYAGADFNPPGPPRFLTRRGPKTQSMSLFLPDRLVVMEEWVDIPFSQFLERVREVAAHTLDAFGLPSFAMQSATLRTTFALAADADALAFVTGQVCGLDGRMEPSFSRPAGVSGLRFVFPPTEEGEGEYHVVIENFRTSRSEVFVEVKAVWPGVPVEAAGIEAALDRLREVRRFIGDEVCPFLQQFDRPGGTSQ
jgi:hypothetical protein